MHRRKRTGAGGEIFVQDIRRREKVMKRRWINILILLAVLTVFAGCGGKTKEEAPGNLQNNPMLGGEIFDDTSVTVFAAKSLEQAMEEMIEAYNRIRPTVTVYANYDSSGTLATQIEEGAACDVFFSASQFQMDELQEAGLILEDSRIDLLKNQLCVVTYPDSGTKVTGLADLAQADSIALAGGFVPVGRYTRQAMINLGILSGTDDAENVSSSEISAALGGVMVNECANVGAVATAVSEGANEVGTVYRSDLTGFSGRLVVLENVSAELTGEVLYPAAQVKNDQADELERNAAADFMLFLASDQAKEIFLNYQFETAE